MISNITSPTMTNPCAYLRGEYAMSEYKIPYYSTVLPMRFIAEEFKLVDDIPGADTIEWSIDELFQRDISWERIDKELSPYLKNTNQPQFFNALTVALLPLTDTGRLGSSYENDDKSKYTPISDDDLEEPIQIGGIQLQKYRGSDNSAGQLRWDSGKIIPVAVDGQHRLAAIKKSLKSGNQNIKNATVPVIFLIPDRRAGYSEPSDQDQPQIIIASLRSIFIDLNKHAKPVSRTRNILLDDMDVPSVCLKTLIGKQLGNIESSIASDKDAYRLPLGVVDWVSESNKFETGPFITTILMLHELVSKLLGLNKPVEEFDLDKECSEVRKWLANKFDIEGDDLSNLMGTAKNCYNEEIPLTFKPDQYTLLGDKFQKKWATNVVRIFTELTPYKEIIEYGKSNKMHEPLAVNAYIAKHRMGEPYGPAKMEKIISEVKESEYAPWKFEDDLDPYISYMNEVKKGMWPFKVVFQRALFSSYAKLWNQSSVFFDDEYVENELYSFTSQWIEAINKFLELGFGDEQIKASGSDLFWSGIGLSADGENIEFTKIASERIALWLNIWVVMYHFQKGHSKNGIKLPTYPKLVAEGRENVERNALIDICRNTLNNRALWNGMDRLAKAKSDEEMDSEQLEDAVEELIKSRYDKMRKKLSSESSLSRKK